MKLPIKKTDIAANYNIKSLSFGNATIENIYFIRNENRICLNLKPLNSFDSKSDFEIFKNEIEVELGNIKFACDKAKRSLIKKDVYSINIITEKKSFLFEVG